MTWLIFFYALTLGAEQSDMLTGYDPSMAWYGYSQFEASAEFIVFAELQYKIFAVGYEHACYHNFQGYYTRDVMGFNRLYLRISNDSR